MGIQRREKGVIMSNLELISSFQRLGGIGVFSSWGYCGIGNEIGNGIWGLYNSDYSVCLPILQSFLGFLMDIKYKYRPLFPKASYSSFHPMSTMSTNLTLAQYPPTKPHLNSLYLLYSLLHLWEMMRRIFHGDKKNFDKANEWNYKEARREGRVMMDLEWISLIWWFLIFLEAKSRL